jgi:phosphoglucosamine mutase
LLVLAALERQGTTLAHARASLRRVPQVMINVKAGGGALLITQPAVKTALQRVETTLRGRGRVVLRASGTEPLVRVTVEGEDEAEVRHLAEELASAVRSAA